MKARLGSHHQQGGDVEDRHWHHKAERSRGRIQAKAAVLKQAQENVEAYTPEQSMACEQRPGQGCGANRSNASRKGSGKQLLRDNGYKISAFDAKELTAYAKSVRKANPELLKKAEANLQSGLRLLSKALPSRRCLGHMPTTKA